jgi:hypothetical protein
MNTIDEALKRVTELQTFERMLDTSTWVHDVDELLTELDKMLSSAVWVKAENLHGIKELAELFSVGRSTVTNWAADQPKFPLPVARLGGGPVYDALDVVRWWLSWTAAKSAKAGSVPDAWREQAQ